MSKGIETCKKICVLTLVTPNGRKRDMELIDWLVHDKITYFLLGNLCEGEDQEIFVYQFSEKDGKPALDKVESLELEDEIFELFQQRNPEDEFYTE